MSPGPDIKEKIILSARKHFAKYGLQGASLKDIAEEAGVASSLINYHFTDRDGLFRACIESFAKTRVHTMNRLVSEAESSEDLRVRLQLFVEEMITSHIDDPEGFEIIQREACSGNPQIMKAFEENMLGAFSNVVKFFAAAQKKNLIRENLDPLILSMMLFSSICDLVRKDHLGKTFYKVSLHDESWRKKVSTQIASVFIQGVIK